MMDQVLSMKARKMSADYVREEDDETDSDFFLGKYQLIFIISGVLISYFGGHDMLLILTYVGESCGTGCEQGPLCGEMVSYIVAHCMEKW